MQQFGPQGVREAADGELGTAISALKRDCAVGERGADLNDRPGILPAHMTEGGKAAVDSAEIGDLVTRFHSAGATLSAGPTTVAWRC
jgi:hypothetical protein